MSPAVLSSALMALALILFVSDRIRPDAVALIVLLLAFSYFNWRPVEVQIWDNLVLETWFRDKQAFSVRDAEFDLIYVNGDNTIAHEFGHLIAYRYGSQAFNGAAPAGWPAYSGQPAEASPADGSSAETTTRTIATWIGIIERASW